MSLEEFEIVRGKLEDHAEVLQFLCDHFLYEETMNVTLRLTKEEFVPFVSDLIADCLASGYTIYAREKATGKMTGIILNNVWRRKDPHGTSFTRHPNPTPAQLFLVTFSDAFWNLVPPNVEAVLHREILSVGVPWQRRGLGSLLIDSGYTLAELKAEGITGFASKTSSLANQKLMAKKGYEELMSIPFSTIRDVDGRPLVSPMDGTSRNILLWKNII